MSICRLVILFAGGFVIHDASAELDHTLSLSVTQIHAYGQNGRMYFGSGVMVAPDRVATNCHVTRAANAVMVSKGPERLRAVAEQSDLAHDICILEVPGAQFPLARLGSAGQVSVGGTIYFYGFPRALGMAFSQGRVEALHPFDGSVVIETTADFTQGASGGGLFDDAGRLIGLATFMPASQHGHNYAIPVDWIPRVMSTAPHAIEPLTGSPFWEKGGSLPAFLKAPATQ